MKANIDRKQTGNSKKQNVETEKDTKAVSCIVSSVIAEKMKPFTEREFTKNVWWVLLERFVPKRKVLLKILVSQQEQWHDELKNCQRILKRNFKAH